MWLTFQSFTFVLLLFSIVKCQTLWLIGSNFIGTNSKYSLFLSSPSNETVSGTLSFKILEYENVQKLKQMKSNLEEIKFDIPNLAQPFCNLRIQYNNPNDKSCKQQTIKLLDISKRPLIFIQTDKPTYQAGDIIKLQVFVLNQKLVPFKEINKMTVAINDANDETFKLIKEPKTSKFGVYEESIQIPKDSQSYGKWKVQITVNGKNAFKKFDVKKFDANSIQLNLVADRIVAYNDFKVYMSVNAKHTQNKPFTGTVDILLTSQFVNSDEILIKDKNVKTFKLSSIKHDFQMKIKDDLGIFLPIADMLLNFTAKFTDSYKKFTTIAQTQILLKHKSRKIISTKRRQFFKPNLEFPVTVQVRHIDKRPDNSFGVLEYFVKYFNASQLINEEHIKTTLTNGDVCLTFSPSSDVDRIVTSYEFDDTTFEETIMPVKSSEANEYIQAYLIKKNTTSRSIFIKSTKVMENLFVMITSPLGIVYHTNYLEAKGKIQYNITIEIIHEMRPESNILVYYLSSSSGAMIFDKLPLIFGFSTVNSLALKTSETVTPGSNITLDISTEDKSMVYLTAIEKGTPNGNEISKQLIDNLVNSYKNIKFMNDNLESFGAFIFDPTTWEHCNDSGSSSQPDPDDDFEDDEAETFVAENTISNFIPNVLFFKNFEANNTLSTITEIASNIGSYRVHGVSMHPSKGLSVVRNQPTILVSSIIELRMEVPAFLYEGESVRIDYTLQKYYEKSMTLTVSIEIENGKIMEKDGTLSTIKQFKIKLTEEDFETTQSIHISPDKNVNFLKISYTDDFNELIEKQINIRKHKKEMEKIVKSSYLICLNKTQKVRTIKDKVDVPKGYKMYARFHRNLLSPMLDGLNNTIVTSIIYEENLVDNLAALAVAAKYYKFHQIESKKLIDPRLKLKDNYNNFIPTIDSILLKNSSSDVRLVAYIARVLIDIKEIIQIDGKIIAKCLNFIKNQQNNDGSFPYDSDLNLRRDMGSRSNQQFVLTAFATLSLIKGKKLIDNSEKIEKSILFLNKTDLPKYNYENAISAYVFAVNEDFGASTEFINNIKKDYQQNPVEKHQSLYVEVASYTILAKILNKIDPYEEIEWLVKQRKTDGSFYSSYDTVLALQALLEYTIFKNISKSNLSYKMNKNSIPTEGLDLEIKSTYNLNVTGEGMEYVMTYYEREDQQQSKQENISVSTSYKKLKNKKVEIIANISSVLNEETSTNMVIIDAKLPRGCSYVSHKGDNILMHKVQNDGNAVTFQVLKMDKMKIYSFSFIAEQLFDIKSSIKPSVRAYDYYRPYFRGISYYNYN